MLDRLLNPLRVIHLVFMIGTIILGCFGAYWSFKEAVAKEFGEVRLEASEKYVRKAEIREVRQDVKENTRLLREIKGILSK